MASLEFRTLARSLRHVPWGWSMAPLRAGANEEWRQAGKEQMWGVRGVRGWWVYVCVCAGPLRTRLSLSGSEDGWQRSGRGVEGRRGRKRVKKAFLSLCVFPYRRDGEEEERVWYVLCVPRYLDGESAAVDEREQDRQAGRPVRQNSGTGGRATPTVCRVVGGGEGRVAGGRAQARLFSVGRSVGR
jgi:hypothetical protein